MLIALLLTSLSWASSSEWKPRYLSGLSLLEVYGEKLAIGGYRVEYDYSYEDDEYNTPYEKEILDSLMRESYRYSLNKIRKLGISPVDCKQDLNVHLVQLDGQTLNNDSRFGSWRAINGGNLVTIHGLYDPTVDTYRESVISFMLLPQGSNNVIVHEMAHYWYDRFCIYDKSNIKTETFAKSVESDYSLGLLD